MAFNAIINGTVSSSPGTVDIDLTYVDTVTGYSIRKTLNLTLDPALTGTQQRAAISATVSADANRYKSTNTAVATLTALIGTTIVI